MPATVWRQVLAETVRSLGDVAPEHDWQWRSLERALDATLGKWDEGARGPGLTLAEGAEITAPEGYRVTMMVDGKKTDITAGTYEGAIVITVSVA